MTSALFSAVDVAAVEATFAVIERFLRRSHMFNDFLIQLSSPQEKERERERERERGENMRIIFPFKTQKTISAFVGSGGSMVDVLPANLEVQGSNTVFRVDAS